MSEITPNTEPVGTCSECGCLVGNAEVHATTHTQTVGP